jgi:hypothetical protein
MAFSRIINTFIVPMGVAITGFIIVWKRKARAAEDKGRAVGK